LIDSAKGVSGTEAFTVYQRALSQGTVLKTFLSASKKFKLNILVPLLQVGGGSSGGNSSLDSRSDRWDSSYYDRHDDNVATSTTLEIKDEAPTGAASSTVRIISVQDASAPTPSASGEGGGSSGSAGSGQGAVKDLIQAVTNGLHL
jgi:hypothetical protein